jgi:hypothetical protein
MIPNYERLNTLRARGLRLTRPRRLILAARTGFEVLDHRTESAPQGP